MAIGGVGGGLRVGLCNSVRRAPITARYPKHAKLTSDYRKAAYAGPVLCKSDLDRHSLFTVVAAARFETNPFMFDLVQTRFGQELVAYRR